MARRPQRCDGCGRRRVGITVVQGRDLCPACAEGKGVYEIPSDVLYPRDARHRFRLYSRVGDVLTVLATSPNPGGLGEAIVQIDADQRTGKPDGGLGDLGATGILDVVDGRWVVSPWHRPDGRRG